MPEKAKLSNEIGNSNNQRLEQINPKWANKRLQKSFSIDEKNGDHSIIFKLSEPQIFEKQLPTVVTAYYHYDKEKFNKLPMPILDPEDVTDQFLIETDIYYNETNRIINTFEAVMNFQNSRLKEQVKDSLMNWESIKGLNNNQDLDFLEKIFIKQDLLSAEILNEMNGVN